MTKEEILTAIQSLAAQFNILSFQLDSLPTKTSSEIAAIYVDMKNINDTYVEVGKTLSKAIDEIKHKILPESFEREGLSSFTTTSGYRVTVSAAVRASLANKDAGYEWLRLNNLSDIITETVNASTLSAVARTLLEEGKELPEEYFKTYIQNTTSVTKVK